MLPVTIIAFVAILGLIIFVHELGHFITAKLWKVKVEEFAFGFPPRLFTVKRGETNYSLNLLPLGGYVKMLGEEDPSDPRSFARRPARVRLLILSAGALMNVILPFVLLSVAFMLPRQVPVGEFQVLQVAQDSPAAVAGIRSGDTLLSINGRPMNNADDLSHVIEVNLGREIAVTVKGTDSLPRTVHLVPRLRYPEGQDPMGTTLDFVIPGTVRVQQVAPDSPAEASGIKTGDTIVFVNNKPVQMPADLRSEIDLNLGKEIALGLRGEDGLERTARLTPRESPPAGQGPTGIVTQLVPDKTLSKSYPFWRAVPQGARTIWDTVTLVKNDVVSWFVQGHAPQVAGPVGIFEITGGAARAGLFYVLQFAAVLSLIVGITNIIPLPALDGGRIFFVLIEIARRGKRISPQKEGLVHMIGFIVLISLMFVVTFFDIMRVIRGGSLLP